MGNHFRRIRLILDALLVLAVVLAIFTYRQSGQANAGLQSQPKAALSDNTWDTQAQSISSMPISGTEVIGNSIILDNETVAAVIAAENAALTPPQYLTSLPVITR
jgi:hypothetical protein